MDWPKHYLAYLLLFSTLLLTGCSSDDGGGQITTQASSRPLLRVILSSAPQELDYLPRSGLPSNDEYSLLDQYAEASGVDIEKIYIDHYDELIPALLAGKGDIIVNNLTVTEARAEQVNFTSPIAYVHEQLIGRPGDTPKSAHALEGRKVAVHRSDAYYDTLLKIQHQRFQPPFEIIEVEESIPNDEIILGVLDGRYDLTVADSNQLEAMHDSKFEIGFDIGTIRPIAWAVRKVDASLLNSINTFLGRHHLANMGEFISHADMQKIKDHGVLRVLTRNNASTYFLWRGELYGFEYDLIKRFADQHDLKLEMVVPPSRDLLIPWLQQGKGDIIAAAMSNTDERQLENIRFSSPYNTTTEIVVSRSGDTIERPEQLAGRRVAVRRSSSYWQSIEALQRQGIAVQLIAAPEELETEELIAQVARGELDLTVADSNILDIELASRNDIRPAFALEERQHGWVVRKENPALLKEINHFLKKEYKGLFYNVTYGKYFRNTERILRHVEERVDTAQNNSLSPYDELVRKYAERFGFDWRLIVSQMYQESRFNPKAKSWVGALGLLQVMPRTAGEFGIDNLIVPENGLHAGMKYLNWLQQRFEPNLKMGERTWFALAAYNAGIGHVRDARTLAARKGWDPNQWFSNVEKAMLLLAQKNYASKAKHGFVRGDEPVNYVRQIRDRYLAYIKLKDEVTVVQLQ